MLLDFDLEKSLESTAYLIKQKGKSESMFFLLKKLYYADRTALIEWGKPITGDKLASLQKGPIVSGIYDLMRGKGSASDLSKWNKVFEKSGNTILLKGNIGDDALSDREKKILEYSAKTIDGIHGMVSDWLHENCPEWKDPGQSSLPIDPSTILRHAHKSEEEIQEIEQANAELRLLSHLLNAR